MNYRLYFSTHFDDGGSSGSGGSIGSSSGGVASGPGNKISVFDHSSVRILFFIFSRVLRDSIGYHVGRLFS